MILILLCSSQDLDMEAQIGGDNHLATVWTHSPEMNYSHITAEATMVVKMASGDESPSPAERRDLLQNPSRWFR